MPNLHFERINDCHFERFDLRWFTFRDYKRWLSLWNAQIALPLVNLKMKIISLSSITESMMLLKLKWQNNLKKQSIIFALSKCLKHKNERRKKLSNSNHHKLLIISIVFILMVIEKWKLMILNDLIRKKLFLI